jgi:hypothetical protein
MNRFTVGQVTLTPTFADKPTEGVRLTLEEIDRRGVPRRVVHARVSRYSTCAGNLAVFPRRSRLEGWRRQGQSGGATATARRRGPAAKTGLQVKPPAHVAPGHFPRDPGDLPVNDVTLVTLALTAVGGLCFVIALVLLRAPADNL